MKVQNKNLDFQGKNIYIGLDVHKRNWTVTLHSQNLVLKTFSMNPSPKELHHYLNRNYPNARYYSVYEAGFCGFWIHRQLEKLGIRNSVVNAADIPTTDKEKKQKRDRVDSIKLARELANGSLHSIYIPDEIHEHLRSLSRLRSKQTTHQTRLKNRIKSYLHLHGIKIPEKSEISPWSGKFLLWLKEIKLCDQPAQDYLRFCLEELISIKNQLAQTTRLLRSYSQNKEFHHIVHNCLMSVPGIGFKTAITYYTEIMTMSRFPKLDHFVAYVGLVPSVSASGDREITKGLTRRQNSYLRHMIIESAWIAARNDPALTLAFEELTKRMSKQEAIVRIAKKLLNRIRYVWQNEMPYEKAVIE